MLAPGVALHFLDDPARRLKWWQFKGQSIAFFTVSHTISEWMFRPIFVRL